MINVAVFGTGRIGKIHINNIAQHADVRLVGICDPYAIDIHVIADRYQTKVMLAVDIFADTSIEIVVIASSTSTHFELIQQSLLHGKHIFCEKPIDLAIDKVRSIQALAEQSQSKFGFGLNRRHDTNFTHLKQAIDAGEIGQLESLSIISRDPAPPPLEYIKNSGGLIRDMMIHDLDMANFLLGSDTIVDVYARGSNFVDPAISAAGDIDGASVHFTTNNGVLGNIINSRRCAYGYDQRIEAFGAKGHLLVHNVPQNFVEKATADAVQHPLPQLFFLQRYAAAYQIELDAFFNWIQGGKPFRANLMDAVYASELAEIIMTSLARKEKMQVDL